MKEVVTSPSKTFLEEWKRSPPDRSARGKSPCARFKSSFRNPAKLLPGRRSLVPLPYAPEKRRFRLKHEVNADTERILRIDGWQVRAAPPGCTMAGDRRVRLHRA